MDSKTSNVKLFSPCRVHFKTCYGCVLDVIVFRFIVISSFVVYFLLEMCPYTVHLPSVFSFFGFRDSQIILEKPSLIGMNTFFFNDQFID